MHNKRVIKYLDSSNRSQYFHCAPEIIHSRAVDCWMLRQPCRCLCLPKLSPSLHCSKVRSGAAGRRETISVCCSAAVLQTDDGLIIHAGLQCTGQWSRHHSGATCDNDCECATVIGRGVRAVCIECRYNKHGQRGHSVLAVECARCQQPSTHRHRHGVVITRLRPRAACGCGLVVV